MNAFPSFHSTMKCLALLGPLLASPGFVHGQGAVAAIPETALRGYPAELAGFLRALPNDTETVTVARNFVYRARERDQPAGWFPGESLAESPVTPQAVFDFAVVPQIASAAKPPLCVRQALRGRHVTLMAAAGRDYRIASAFGSYVYESAGLYVMRDPLESAGDQLRNSLSSEQTSSRVMAGHNVFVLPVDRSDRESYVATEAWEGAYVVLLDERTIVTATSDRMLEQLLRGLGDAPRSEPPPVLRLLAEVEPDDNAWQMRIPTATAQTRKLARTPLYSTLVWRWRSERAPEFIACYRPAPGRTLDDVQQAVGSYFRRKGEPPLDGPLQSEKLEGEVQFTLSVPRVLLKDSRRDAEVIMRFGFLFLYHHQGMY